MRMRPQNSCAVPVTERLSDSTCRNATWSGVVRMVRVADEGALRVSGSTSVTRNIGACLAASRAVGRTRRNR